MFYHSVVVKHYLDVFDKTSEVTIMLIDFLLQNHGSIYILIPWSESAKDWTAKFIDDDAQWFGQGFVEDLTGQY